MLCVSSVLTASPAQAATIDVTTTADDYNTGATCSLREALQAANTDAAYGGCAAGSGADTIRLGTTQQTYNLTRATNLVIVHSVTIDGRGSIIKGTQSAKGLYVNDNISLSLKNVAITGFGTSTPLAVKGKATLKNVDIHDNVSTSVPPQTLGIWVDPTGELYATDSSLRNNSAIKGGGIYNVGGHVVLTNVTIANNFSSQYGGGIMTVSGGDAYLYNCTVSGNRANGYQGGGVYVGDTSFTQIFSSTIVNNSSGQGGGGLYIEDTTTSLYMRNSILDNNTGPSAGCLGSVYSLRGNVVGFNACTLLPTMPSGAPADLTNTGALLGSLASPGAGKPLVHTPLRFSPVIDRIPESYCTDRFDQLNAVRPRGRGCEVGAVEVSP
jgi:CSLREA domain-containing protein